LRVVKRVSKSWYQLASSNYVWKCVSSKDLWSANTLKKYESLYGPSEEHFADYQTAFLRRTFEERYGSTIRWRQGRNSIDNWPRNNFWRVSESHSSSCAWRHFSRCSYILCTEAIATISPHYNVEDWYYHLILYHICLFKSLSASLKKTNLRLGVLWKYV
jgi:hypothetical protein